MIEEPSDILLHRHLKKERKKERKEKITTSHSESNQHEMKLLYGRITGT